MSFQKDHANDFDQDLQEEFYDESDDIAEKQAELNDLLDKIDDSQLNVDRMSEEIAEKKVEITHLKNEVEQLKKLKQKQTIEGNYGLKSPNFDITQLNPEHRDLVNEILDRIYNREMELEKIEGENSNLNAEVDAIILENESLSQQIRKYKTQIDRKRQDHQFLRSEIQLTQQKIKESEQTIRMNNQTLKITTAAVNGLANRQDDFENEVGGTTELEKLIASTEMEIAQEQLDIDTTEEQIRKMTELHQEAICQMDSDLKSHTDLINWDGERKAINDEIEATKIAIKEAKVDNESKNSSYASLFNRYRLLAPIVKKWCTTDLSGIEDNPDADIDQLIEKANKASEASFSATEKKNDSLDQKIKENAALEAKNIRKREELEREIQLFHAEEKRLKESIEYQRTRAFEEEHDIVSQISRIKVKIAQIKNKA